ncbi:WD40/YVTN/BNR-like repeat-containing protein [Alicyclobacillus dauci]|uniref:BNR repeat-like domain-containing protein n=1 Tax=Alicyclobacillus dauci TaxID=1475485 RepID=A0ABY6Z868_9BACL|nr:hypothetical protein [Alicyclobacillus dauci]WAH38451.1 hypothetical protein NZD86_08215 [Alicyclobacillus dauci]
MRLQRAFVCILSIAALVPILGCGTWKAEAGSITENSSTSSFVSNTITSSLVVDHPHYPIFPASTHLNVLEHTNTWYNFSIPDGENGYRWGYMNGRFTMERTNSGGRTWCPVVLPVSWSQGLMMEGNGQLENPNVQVVNGHTIRVFGVIGKRLEVLCSNDGGDEFTRKRIPLPVSSLRLESVSMPKAGTKSAWVLLRGTGKMASVHELLHVQEEGGTCSLEHLVQGTQDAGLPVNAQGTVHFMNTHQGWVVATTSDGQLHVYMTSDEGDSWSHRIMEPPHGLTGWKAAKVYPPALCGKEATFVVRFVGLKQGRASVEPVVYRTRDGAGHFDGQVVSMLTDAVSNYTGNPVCFINPKVGYAVSGGHLMRTADAGSKWESVRSLQLENTLHQYPCVLGMDFISTEQGFILLQSHDHVHNILLRTVNQGSSWTVV